MKPAAGNNGLFGYLVPDTVGSTVEVRDDVRGQRVRLLYEQASLGFVLSLMASFSLGLVLFSQLAPALIIGWWTTHLAVTVGRYVLVRRYRRRSPDSHTTQYWRRAYRIGAGLTGLVWGIGSTMLLAQVGGLDRTLILFVLAAMVAGAIPFLAVVVSAYGSYMLAATLPPIVFLAAQGDSTSVAMACGACAFCVGGWITAVRLHTSLSGALLLQAENHQLALHLEGANHRLETELDERMQAEAARRTSEERFRGAFESGVAGMAMFSLDGRFMKVNQACCDITGYGESDLVGQHYTVVLQPNDVEPVADELQRLLTGQRQPVQYETRYRHRSGQNVYCLAGFSVLKNGAGKPDSFIVQILDITRRKQAEEQRLERVNRQRDALVREVHHRIKNNLQGVVGLLAEHVHRHPELAEIIGTVSEQIGAVALVHGLRTIDGATSTVFEHLIESITQAVPGAGVEYSRAARPNRESLTLLAESEAVPMALIVNELVTNAIKHGRTDATPSVKVALSTEGDTARVEISNPIDEATEQAGAGFGDDTGAGEGLALINALMPSRGAQLSFTMSDQTVRAILVLQAPVIEFDTAAEDDSRAS